LIIALTFERVIRFDPDFRSIFVAGDDGPSLFDCDILVAQSGNIFQIGSPWQITFDLSGVPPARAEEER
jgi:hypothetical protein